jgi:hypothetical protein
MTGAGIAKSFAIFCLSELLAYLPRTVTSCYPSGASSSKANQQQPIAVIHRLHPAYRRPVSLEDLGSFSREERSWGVLASHIRLLQFFPECGQIPRQRTGTLCLGTASSCRPSRRLTAFAGENDFLVLMWRRQLTAKLYMPRCATRRKCQVALRFNRWSRPHTRYQR